MKSSVDGRNRLLWVVLPIGAIAVVFSFWAPGAQNFNRSELARILFYHLPAAMLTPVLLAMSGWFGFKYLQNHKEADDVRNCALLEFSMFFASFTMITGIIFSKVQWGEWWHWDPRQTSFLMVLLLLSAAMVLRTAFTDQERKATASAFYSVISIVPLMFLIFVFPRLPQVAKNSLHPSTTILKGELDGTYWTGVLLILTTLCIIIRFLYQMRVRAELLERELIKKNGQLEIHRDGSATAPVVRPLHISSKD
ncbi:MAG: cytochrome c biogenesis protein CcsA [Armatimonadetes bacterium]|nr:cytochrome c biogenesis protein CcsA [Armatimonadota bacterium]